MTPTQDRLPLALAMLLFVGIAQADSSTNLMRGDDLEGWSVGPSGPETANHWRVEDGVIVGDNANKAASILWTDAEFGDFDLTLEYKTPSEYYDSGVFVRGDDYQVQIGISSSLKIDLTGCIYAPIDGRGGYPAKSDAVVANQRVGEWNSLRMRVVGDRVETFLNGHPIVDYTMLKPPARGPIGLQLHQGHHMRLLFRNLSLSEIESTGEAATD